MQNDLAPAPQTIGMVSVPNTLELQLIADRFARSRAMRTEAAKHHKHRKQLSWRRAPLDRVYLDGFELNKPDFCGSSGILFFARGSKMLRANFEDTNLWSPYFLKADLRWASFKNSRLPYAHFWKANLHGCDFSGCDLYGANFRGANVEGCKWDGAKLEGVVGLNLITGT